MGTERMRKQIGAWVICEVDLSCELVPVCVCVWQGGLVWDWFWDVTLVNNIYLYYYSEISFPMCFAVFCIYVDLCIDLSQRYLSCLFLYSSMLWLNRHLFLVEFGKSRIKGFRFGWALLIFPCKLLFYDI